MSVEQLTFRIGETEGGKKTSSSESLFSTQQMASLTLKLQTSIPLSLLFNLLSNFDLCVCCFLFINVVATSRSRIPFYYNHLCREWFRICVAKCLCQSWCRSTEQVSNRQKVALHIHAIG